MYLMGNNRVIVGCKLVRLDNHDKTLQQILDAQKHADEQNGQFIIYDIKIVSHSDKYGNGAHWAYVFYTGEFPEESYNE